MSVIAQKLDVSLRWHCGGFEEIWLRENSTAEGSKKGPEAACGRQKGDGEAVRGNPFPRPLGVQGDNRAARQLAAPHAPAGQLRSSGGKDFPLFCCHWHCGGFEEIWLREIGTAVCSKKGPEAACGRPGGV